MSCPMCQKPTNPRYRPFCSKRCADIDLGKWMSGAYATASRDPEDAERVITAMERDDDGSGNLH